MTRRWDDKLGQLDAARRELDHLREAGKHAPPNTFSELAKKINILQNKIRLMEDHYSQFEWYNKWIIRVREEIRAATLSGRSYIELTSNFFDGRSPEVLAALREDIAPAKISLEKLRRATTYRANIYEDSSSWGPIPTGRTHQVTSSYDYTAWVIRW